MIQQIFWDIIGLGLALPCSFVFILNLVIKIQVGDVYQIDLIKLGIIYFIALCGWAIFIGIV